MTITIRNVPDETRDTLSRRASAEGQSMQEYLRGLLIAQTSRLTGREWVDRARAFARTLPPPDPDELPTAEIIRQEREAHDQLVYERSLGMWRDG